MPSENDSFESPPLLSFMQAAPEAEVSLDADALLDLLRPLGEFAEPVRDLAVLQLVGESDVPLEMRVGKWRWNATQGAVQSAIATAVLLPVCYATGVVGIPAVVLAAVLPLLLNVEKIEVRASDLHVLATVKDELYFPNDIERVYDQLPEDLRHEITLLEFRDLVQRLTATGHLNRNHLGRYHMSKEAFRATRDLLR